MARKRGMQFIPYDYEAAYNKAMEDMHEWFIENLFQHRKKVIYALKEITAGDQFEIEIYPQFRSMDEVPPEGRTIKKDNNKAQKNLNDKNARKYVERLINENFSDRDIWMTLTYDDAHLPPDGDVDAAIKNVQKYIRRINYQRKKRGLPNAKYVYVTAYNPDAEIRWHHHIVMDGALDMETVESCWKQSSRNEVRRLQTDENGLSGMANYIVEEKNRVPSEKRWNSSQGLRDPRIKVVHSKRPATGGSYKKIGSFVDGMVKDRDSIPEILKKWYPDMDFTNANVYYNDFNCMRRHMRNWCRIRKQSCRQQRRPKANTRFLTVCPRTGEVMTLRDSCFMSCRNSVRIKAIFRRKCRYTQDVYASKMTFPMPLCWQSSSMNPDMNLTRSETAGSQRDICRFMRNGTLTG